MIEAFAIAKKNNIINLKLLIAGSKVSNKYYKNILDTIIETNTLDDVILLGSISKEDLRFLYSNCEFLIFPSPCENFAYTLVEAMCCGTPIICTNTTAMPETCQEAAIYFDPNNTKEMAEKIELLICDENLRETLSRKSLERVKELPDYKEVTIKTLDIMRNLYSQSIS
jgi:glycosyltransferase involved in cell wall biosynthesis